MWLTGKKWVYVQHDEQGGMSNSYSAYEKPTHNSNFAPFSMERRHSSFGKSDQKPTFQHSEMLYPLSLPSHQDLSICNYLIPGRTRVDNEIPTKSSPQWGVQTSVPQKNIFKSFPCDFFSMPVFWGFFFSLMAKNVHIWIFIIMSL